MKKVYTASVATKAHIAKNLLAGNGIEAFVQDEVSFMVMGVIPWRESWPTLWVNDADEAAALELLKNFDKESTGEKTGEGWAGPVCWTCPVCGESINAQFDACWKCAAAGQLSAPALKLPPEGPLPLGLRLCSLSRRLVNWSLFATFVVLCLSSLGLFGELLTHSRSTGAIFAVAFVPVLALTLIFLFLHFLVIAFFVARYSLRQMLGAIIILNILLVLIVSLDGFWKAFPIGVLIGCVLFVANYVLSQDPYGRSYTPAFIREYLNKKQKQQK